MKKELDTIYLNLSLIRDREDCPEKIRELIDEIRDSDLFSDLFN
jgi:hypothetical protein